MTNLSERLPEATFLAQRTSERMSGWLARYSIVLLRVSIGLVFLTFGVLKFFPGASPAADMAVRTLETLSFGLVSGDTARILTAMAETFIGLTLVSGRLLWAGLIVLAGAMVGILSPLVLFFGDLFPGAPTLWGQYVMKDVILVAAGLVVTAGAMGARLVADQQRSG